MVVVSRHSRLSHSATLSHVRVEGPASGGLNVTKAIEWVLDRTIIGVVDSVTSSAAPPPRESRSFLTVRRAEGSRTDE